MKKILLSNISFFGCYGGVENSLRFLAKEYVLMNLKVLILSGYNYNAENGGEFKRCFNLDGIKHYKFRYKPFQKRILNVLFIPFIPFDIFYTLYLIKREYINYSISRNQFVCFFVNLFFSSINIYLAPGFSSYQSSKEFLGREGVIANLKRKIHNFFDLQAIRASKKVAVFSNNMLYQADCILKESNSNFDISKIKLFKPGVDETIFHPVSASDKSKIRSTLGLPTNKKIVLCVGRFVSAKGFDLVIKSMEYLNVKDTVLVIVGDGDLYKEYAEIIESKSMSDNVILVGSSNRTALYYQACDYFFMSSIYEPLGQTILEAIASGLPILAFKKEIVLTATHEILGEDIFITLSSKQPNIIASDLAKLANTDEALYISNSNKVLELSKKYNWSVLAKNLIE